MCEFDTWALFFLVKINVFLRRQCNEPCYIQVKPQKNHSRSKAAIHLAYMVKSITGAKYNANLFSLYSGWLVPVGRAKSWCMCTGRDLTCNQIHAVFDNDRKRWTIILHRAQLRNQSFKLTTLQIVHSFIYFLGQLNLPEKLSFFYLHFITKW